ncbi:T9SSC-terminal target domain-containing protein [Haloferula helveola]|uniref:T9SSC-terminal target domain-containing protein n=1 Tax=Haloferula helveola TaxID=490095 RepID=A0ABN6H296_9BACT|nr:T9SSC-terminal target domain-containing protein [Haloferula helveola]
MKPTFIPLFAILVIGGTAAALPPLDSDIHAWFVADAGVTTDGTEVLEWTDQVGGFTMTPPIDGPELLPNQVNSLPSLYFDGSTQLTGSLGATPLSSASIFALFRCTLENGNNDYVYTLGTDGGSGSQMALSRDTGNRAYHYDGALENQSVNGAMPGDTWFVSSQIFGEDGPNSHDLYLNGSAVVRSNASGPYSANVTGCVIGNWSSGLYRHVGDLVELIVYDRTLSESERTEVEEYLRQKASIPAFFKPEAEVLSDWEVIQYELGAQPDANWTFDLGGTRADQSTNADASILLSDIDVAYKVVWGQFGSGSAPDFMGFVFGYQDRGHYYLFDWKKTTDSYLSFGAATSGMRLTAFHVDGADPSGRDFWASDIAANTTVLEQNNIPWADGVDYDFSLSFTPGAFTIRVWEGETVIQTWTVADTTHTSGRFGYFINSLQNVRFGQVFSHDIGPVFIDGIDRAGTDFSLRWSGGEPPYVLETSSALDGFTPATGHLWDRFLTLQAPGPRGFYRIRSIGSELSAP